MNEPVWIVKEALILLHAKSLARFGGAEGIRDDGLLESALARPVNAFHYEPQADVASLAASYAFGLIKNHPFVDGNKRAAFLAVGLFLGENRHALNADTVETLRAVLALAEGQINEREFAIWLRLNIAQT